MSLQYGTGSPLRTSPPVFVQASVRAGSGEETHTGNGESSNEDFTEISGEGGGFFERRCVPVKLTPRDFEFPAEKVISREKAYEVDP